MSFKIPALIFLQICASVAGAQTINAASCNQSDVQNAFNSITSSTTTVNIPAGTCTWNSTVTLTQPTGSTSLTIQGQTTCTGDGNPANNNLACTDSTLINDGMSYTSADPPLLSVTTLAGASFRMTGLTFNGTGSLQTYNGAINIYGGSQAVRVDHNHIENIHNTPLNTGAGIAGVYDHNIWYNNPSSVLFHITGASGSDWSGNIPWSQPTALGTSNFVFFEDNLIQGGGNDCDHGGRFVVRYNTFVNNGNVLQYILTHPTGEPGGAIRGCRAWEVYGNAMINNNYAYMPQIFFIDTGTGVDWGNVVSGSDTTNNYFEFLNVRSNSNTYTQVPTPNGWGNCGTAFSGTGSAWDQTSNTPSGYRCIDQLGSGQGDLLTVGGNFPTIVDTVTGKISYPNEALEPVYSWMDTFPGGGAFVNNQEPTVIHANQDYYLWCDPNSTTGCTSFNGTVGVGSGPLASRPSTCTTGVAYWATDQGNWNQSGIGGRGELFNCTSTNTWTLFYTPYTYPHPLVTGNAAAVNPPTGLTGTVVQ